MKRLITILNIGLLLQLGACSTSFVMPSSNGQTVSSDAAPRDTLYAALGGNQGVSQIVDGLLARIAADQRIVHHFQETDIALFRQSLIDHLCVVTDGGCLYEGETMANSHQGLGITQADFDALVGHLIASMQAQNIDIATRNSLLKRLAPMYSEVTYR